MTEPEDLFAVRGTDQFKMDGNNNNRITGAPAASQFSFPSLAGYAATGATVGHDVSLAQILYYQNLLKQQTNTTTKLQNRSPLPQYTVINNPSILPQVPGSPTNRSFAAALRNLAKQIGPGPSTSPERDNNLSDTDSRQPSPKARASSALLRNSSPTQNASKTNDKSKVTNSNSETRSGFQPYRPEENRASLTAQSPAPSPNPYGLDPATAAAAAAAYSPYHAAAAAAAAAAAFYPPHLQHAYRLEEQLYLERCGVPMFPPSPYASPLYGMMPTALGLVSPALHERLKLEEEQRQRETLERERSEREKREKSKKSPRASPSHSHLTDASARKAPLTVSPGLANQQTPPPPQPSPSLSSSSSKHSQSSPTNQLPATNCTPFMRPFEDSYTSPSASASHSPSPVKAKNSFLSSLTDTSASLSTLAGNSHQNSLNSAATPSASPFTPLPATKLPNPFECFTTPKTPDGSLIVDPPTAHLASSQTSVASFLSASSSTIGAGMSAPAELSSFPSVAANSVSSNPSFKPFPYPYDLIQYPPFKNHMMAPAAAASTLSPPLPKKARSAAGENAKEVNAAGRSTSSKGGRGSGGGKSRAKKSAAAADKKLSSSSSSSSTTSSSSSIVCDLNSAPLNLSTSVNCEGVEKQSPNRVDPATPVSYDLNNDVAITAKDESAAAYSVVTEVN